jgi:hypothetical protein
LYCHVDIFRGEWMCTQECWNPEVAIMFGTAARYRRAAVGSSHDDARPDNLTFHAGADIKKTLHSGYVVNVFFISRRTGHRKKCSQLFRSFRGHALFVRGKTHP